MPAEGAEAVRDGRRAPEEQQPRQRRAQHTRTRSGCERCRAGRRKCQSHKTQIQRHSLAVDRAVANGGRSSAGDEGKPQCRRCRLAGAQCQYVKRLSFRGKDSRTPMQNPLPTPGAPSKSRGPGKNAFDLLTGSVMLIINASIASS